MNEEQKNQFRKLIGEKRISDGEVFTCAHVDYQFSVGFHECEIEEIYVYVELKIPMIRSAGIPFRRWQKLPLALGE